MPAGGFPIKYRAHSGVLPQCVFYKVRLNLLQVLTKVYAALVPDAHIKYKLSHPCPVSQKFSLLVNLYQKLDIWLAVLARFNKEPMHAEINKTQMSLMVGSRSGGGGGQRPGPTPEESQKYRFFLQYWSRTSEKPSQHSMLGYHQPASETPFKCRFAGGPMMATFSVI